MYKFSHLPVLNQGNSEKFILPGVNNLTLEANISSMSLSSFGGLPILQNEERHLALSSQFASCITDKRSQHLVRHSLEEIIMMRVFQISLGCWNRAKYEINISNAFSLFYQFKD